MNVIKYPQKEEWDELLKRPVMNVDTLRETVCRVLDDVKTGGDRAVMAALQAGVDSIEHGAYLSESVLLRMAQQRTLWVPTLSTIGNLIGSGRYPDAVLKRLLAQQQEAVRFVAAHGGRIGLGSDAGAWHVMHGQAISDELGYLTAALGPRTEPLLLEAEAYASVTFCRK